MSNLKWDITKSAIIWTHSGKTIELETKYPPFSVIALKDKTGIAVVFSDQERKGSNASVINADGSVRFELEIPSEIKDFICFHEIYYIDNELTAIIATRNCDYAYTFNSSNGGYIKKYETR